MFNMFNIVHPPYRNAIPGHGLSSVTFWRRILRCSQGEQWMRNLPSCLRQGHGLATWLLNPWWPCYLCMGQCTGNWQHVCSSKCIYFELCIQLALGSSYECSGYHHPSESSWWTWREASLFFATLLFWKSMVVSFLKGVKCPSCFSFSPTFCTSLSRKGIAKKEEDDDDDEPDHKTEIKEGQDDSEDSDNVANRAKREDAEDLVRKARFNLEKLN